MQIETIETLESNNKTAGFCGAIRQHADSGEAWRLAMAAIAEATGCPAEAIRGFLDGRYGRHFAEDVVTILASRNDLPTAIDDAVALWMERRIDERIEEELGIPSGLPRLVGFVRMHEALLETGEHDFGVTPLLH